jgi:hypothetical protein
MRNPREETIIRWARIRSTLKPVPIFDARSVEPIDAAFLAASYCPKRSGSRGMESQEGYCLYFLGSNGGILEVLQFDTLRILEDQAWDIVGIAPKEWNACEIPVGDGEIFDVGQFSKSPAG